MTVVRFDRRDALAMIAFVAVGCAVTIAWGERIGINNGEGWDGVTYATWAGDVSYQVLHRGITAFQAQRVLPSLLVHLGARAVGAPLNPVVIVRGFAMLDALALVATAVLLGRIAVALAWSRAAAWVAFAATFLCFANARQALYDPVLTDPLAYALAMAIVWAFVARRPLALWLGAVAAAFTWPALLTVAVPMLVLPRPRASLPPVAGRWSRPAAVVSAALTAAFIVMWFADVLRGQRAPIASWMSRSHESLWPVTIAIIAISSAAAAYVVTRQDRVFSLRAYARDVGGRRLAIGVVGVVALLAIRAAWLSQLTIAGASFGLIELEYYYVATALRGPLWNLVHAVVYFGPIVLLTIGCWPRIAALAADWGPAAVVALGATVVFAVGADARHLLHVMPFVTVATVTATATWWTPRRALGFGALSLAWSKLWLVMAYHEHHDSLEWPDLRYFMQQGPWASDATFLVHLAAAVVTAAILWWMLRSPATSARAARP